MASVYMFYGMMSLLSGASLYGMYVAVDIWLRKTSLKKIAREYQVYKVK